MKRWSIPALLIAMIMLLSALPSAGCAAKNEASTQSQAPMAMSAMADAAMETSEESYGYTGTTWNDTLSETQKQPTDFDVRKIVYDATMSVTADDPANAMQTITRKATELGGYVAQSYANSDDAGISYCSATLRVPAEKLDELVQAAEAMGKVGDYRLSSDDISQSYYDIQARLKSAKAEEQQLLEIMSKCETVEDLLRVRQSLSEVRANIESYQGQINLWDNLVSYATLELTVNRTPRTAVEKENELATIWKASDVWKRMANGFINSARYTVNAISAIGIFLAVAIIPAGILFLCIGLPMILHKKKKKRLAQQKKNGTPAGDPAQDISITKNLEKKNE